MAETEKKLSKQEIVIYIKNFKIIGQIPTHEGYRGRLSDLINDERKFLNITNAEILSASDNKVVHKVRFLCLNKNQIILIHPVDEEMQ